MPGPIVALVDRATGGALPAWLAGNAATLKIGRQDDPQASAFQETLVHPVHQLPEGFVVEVAGPPHRPVLRCAGELDLASVPQLDSSILAIIDLDPPAIAIDLSEVTFADLCGISPILDLRQECHSRNIESQLIPSPRVTRLLNLIEGIIRDTA